MTAVPSGEPVRFLGLDWLQLYRAARPKPLTETATEPTSVLADAKRSNYSSVVMPLLKDVIASERPNGAGQDDGSEALQEALRCLEEIEDLFQAAASAALDSEDSMQESPISISLDGDLCPNKFYAQLEIRSDELPFLPVPLSPWASNSRVGAPEAAFALYLHSEEPTPPSPCSQPEPVLATLVFDSPPQRPLKSAFPLSPTSTPQPLLVLLSPLGTFPVVDSAALLAGMGAAPEQNLLATAAASPSENLKEPPISLGMGFPLMPSHAETQSERSDTDLLALLAGPCPSRLQEPLSPPPRRPMQLQHLLQPTPLPVEPPGMEGTADDLRLLGRKLKAEGEAILSERRATAVLSLAHRHLLLPEPPLEGLTCQNYPGAANILHLCPCELEGECIADSMLLSWTLAAPEPPLAAPAASSPPSSLPPWQQPLVLYPQLNEPPRECRVSAISPDHLPPREGVALASSKPIEGSMQQKTPPQSSSLPPARFSVAPSSLQTFLALRGPTKAHPAIPLVPSSSPSKPREGLNLPQARRGSPEPKREASAALAQPPGPAPGEEAVAQEPLEVDVYCAAHLFQDELELMALEQHGFRCVPLPLDATVADVVIDEACGVLLLHASALQEQSQVAAAVHRLYRQSFAFIRCHVLILTEQRDAWWSHGVKQLFGVAAAFHGSNLHVEIEQLPGLAWLGSALRRLAVRQCQRSPLAREDWLDRSWMPAGNTTGSASTPLSFLLASRCLNVMSAQALLVAFKLHEIIQLPLEVLASAVPQVPTHSLQMLKAMLQHGQAVGTLPDAQYIPSGQH